MWRFHSLINQENIPIACYALSLSRRNGQAFIAYNKILTAGSHIHPNAFQREDALFDRATFSSGDTTAIKYSGITALVCLVVVLGLAVMTNAIG